MEKQQASTNTFSVKDLSVAAFLYSCDQVHLTRTERDRTGDVLFYFSPKQHAEELIASYWADNAPLVQPRKLFSALRDLKDMIFSGG